MEAQVTIKLSPSELDMLRLALETLTTVSMNEAENRDLDPPTRRASRERQAQAAFLREKL